MDKLWLRQYQKGVPAEIALDEYHSLVNLFEQSCEKFNFQTAFINHGTKISFHALECYTRYFAAYLQSLNLSQHARVAIMLPNCLQYPIALFAILRSGFIVVNTNPLYTSDELKYQLKDSGAEAIIVFKPMAHVLEQALPDLPQLKHIIITDLGDCFPWAKKIITHAIMRYIKKMHHAFNIPQAIGFSKALHLGKTLKFTVQHITQQNIAFIQYTGGTTGVAKGAILSHGNLLANIAQASAWISPLQLGTKDMIITALPLYHIFSLTANCLTFLKIGAQNVLITNPKDMPSFIRILKKSPFTVITGVNTLFNALLHNKSFAKINFSNLKLALAGGMALQKRVANLWNDITHSPILEAYGLTETSPAVTINPMNLKKYNHSIGLPLPSTDISIRDEQGQEVPLNTPGELCVKGPQVTQGYWQNVAESKNIFADDGFLRTGDIAKMDEKGFIYLVDRKKEMILVSGFNVYPNEIEAVISQMPEVAEVGVIGVQDENGDERVKACVVKRSPHLTVTDIKTYCRKHLTAYKVPKLIQFYDTLPKSNVGKILRRALKDM